MPVATAKVQGRRKLDYKSLDEVVADAERLAAGPVRALGNWSPGQIFKHLALAYNGSIDGFPFKFPWHFRAMAKLFKKQLLAGAMPPGFKMSAERARVTEAGPTSTEDGLADLRAAVTRLKQETRRASHPIFGELTNDEWNQVHLKHAGLHLSFLVPE